MALNFSLPIDVSRLENDRLKLTPIEHCPQSVWNQYHEETSIKHPELWKYMPFGPFQTLQEHQASYRVAVGDNPNAIIFAILLKAGKIQKKNSTTGQVDVFEVTESTFAGTCGLLNALPEQSSVEIGHIMMLTPFHRTFVNTHANALLLKHLLDPIEGGDLGMRRVQWQANADNKPSVGAAQRLGFHLEGIIRWQRIIGEGKECASVREGVREERLPVVDKEGRKLGPGRHSAILAICWDDWLEESRDHVTRLLEI